MHWLILLWTLLIGTGVWAEDKPQVPIAEPRRHSVERSVFMLVEGDYDLAEKGVDRLSLALSELIRFTAAETQVAVRLDKVELKLNEPQLLESGLLYLTGNQAALMLGQNEKANLGRFLRGGGLLFAEDVRPSFGGRRLRFGQAGVRGTPFDRQLKALMKDPLVLGAQGAHWQSVANDHPLYSIFFDFPAGPPLSGVRGGGNVNQLEMLEQRGRVSVIFSDLNISWFWHDPTAQGRQSHLQFGANLILFALAQQAAGPPLQGP